MRLGDVGHLPRQLQVLEKPFLVVLALLPVEHQPVIQDVRLERVVDRIEPAGEGLQPVEIRCQCRRDRAASRRRDRAAVS